MIRVSSGRLARRPFSSPFLGEAIGEEARTLVPGHRPGGRAAARGGESALTAGPRILLIDDDPADRALAAAVLARELGEVRVEEIDGAAPFAAALRRPPPALVITELRLEWSEGRSILAASRDAFPQVPVVGFTADRDLERAVAALKGGLFDFVSKDSHGFLRLPKVARRAIERDEASGRVSRSEAWLHDLLDRAEVGVLRSCVGRRRIETNGALLRLLGVGTLAEALRLELPTRLFRPSRAGSSEPTAGADGLGPRLASVERPDGSIVELLVSELLMPDESGADTVVALFQRAGEVAQQAGRMRRRVSELERSNADLTDFASVASHQLQEPLRMVEKYSEVLGEELPSELGREASVALDFLRGGARRMRSMVDDLLQFSRINAEGPDFAACDVNEIVDRVVRDLQPALEESGAQIGREPLPTVVADPSDLEQVFQGLLSNAVKFRGERPPRVRVAARRDGGDWVFLVRDNGIGIEPAETTRIFDIFRRLHPEVGGTGIGLAICRRLVERQGGKIWVDSRPGEGSTFLFSVPGGSVTATARERPPDSGGTRQ